MSTDPRYPIGRFSYPGPSTPAQRSELINIISSLPADLRTAVHNLSDAQLDTPYREDGWTVRQLVHHVADSHVNSYVRLRLALTEANPIIKPYEEALWANLADANSLPLEPSFQILTGIHVRWVALLKSLEEQDYQRTFQHPESGNQTLDRTLSLYAWHSRHHTAHITALRHAKGW